MSIGDLTSIFAPSLEALLARIISKRGSDIRAAGESEKARQAIITAEMSAEFTNSMDYLKELLASFVHQIPRLAEGLAALVAREVIGLRRRQQAATGMDDESYDAMVEALVLLEMATPALRILFSEGGAHAELSVAGTGGFRLSTPTGGGHLVEVVQLQASLRRTKIPHEKALACFLQAFLNQRPLRMFAAHACAKYGGPNDPDYDLLLPDLRTGIEVKLFLAPAAFNDDKAATSAHEIAKQLRGYRSVGCDRIILLTNLETAACRELASAVEAKLEGAFKPEVRGIRFVDDLVRFAEELEAEVKRAETAAFEGRMRKLLEVAQQPEATPSVTTIDVYPETKPPEGREQVPPPQQGDEGVGG